MLHNGIARTTSQIGLTTAKSEGPAMAVPASPIALDLIASRCAVNARDMSGISSRLSSLLYRMRAENTGDGANDKAVAKGDIGGSIGSINEAIDEQVYHINECWGLLARLEELA